MVTTFVSKLSGFFAPRFIIANWSPVAICLGLAIVIATTLSGMEYTMTLWTNLSATEQSLLAGVTLFAITVLAFILQALTASIVRLYEGFWPSSLSWLKNWACSDQKKSLEGLEKSDDYSSRYYYFPRSSSEIRATRLGNALAAAEQYPFEMYRLDAILWWPRLVALLPDSYRAQIDSALTPLIALLNLSALLVLLALGGGFAIVLADHRWWLFVLTVLIGLLLARTCYLAAISQAVAYGDLIRVAFDLYRHEILKMIHLPVPDNLVEERLLWDSLNLWVYHFTPPWESGWPPDETELPSKLFYYDSHSEPTPQKPKKIEVTIKDSPTLTIHNPPGGSQ